MFNMFHNYTTQLVKLLFYVHMHTDMFGVLEISLNHNNF
jgi:hypothetical protein